MYSKFPKECSAQKQHSFNKKIIVGAAHGSCMTVRHMSVGATTQILSNRGNVRGFKKEWCRRHTKHGCATRRRPRCLCECSTCERAFPVRKCIGRWALLARAHVRAWLRHRLPLPYHCVIPPGAFFGPALIQVGPTFAYTTRKSFKSWPMRVCITYRSKQTNYMYFLL